MAAAIADASQSASRPHKEHKEHKEKHHSDHKDKHSVHKDKHSDHTDKNDHSDKHKGHKVVVKSPRRTGDNVDPPTRNVASRQAETPPISLQRTLHPSELALSKLTPSVRSSSSVAGYKSDRPALQMVRRKDPLDLCNEVIAALRGRDTLVRKINADNDDPFRKEPGHSMREDKSGSYARKKFFFRAWPKGKSSSNRTRKFFKAWALLLKIRGRVGDEDGDGDEEENIGTSWLKQGGFGVQQHQTAKRALDQDSQLTQAKYCPEVAANMIWQVKGQSSIWEIEKLHRVEKYRGLLSRLMVPEYGTTDYEDLVTRPSRHSKNSIREDAQKKQSKTTAPAAAPEVNHDPYYFKDGQAQLRQSDFRFPDIVPSLEKGRFTVEECKSAQDKECSPNPKWVKKFGVAESNRQRRGSSSEQVPFWF